MELTPDAALHSPDADQDIYMLCREASLPDCTSPLFTIQPPTTKVSSAGAMAVLSSIVGSTFLGPHIRELSQESWTLNSPALDITVPAQFPSQVHVDLFREGVIGTSVSALYTKLDGLT